MIDVKKLSDKEREELLLKIEQTAAEDERAVTGCARSALHALVEHLELGNEEAIKTAAPLAGGVARSGNLCGALMGGIMAMGLAYAPSRLRGAYELPGYSKSQDLAGVFLDRFESEFGALNCREIQHSMFGRSWNLRDPAERADYLKPELHDRCGDVAGKAARLAAQVILEDAE